MHSDSVDLEAMLQSIQDRLNELRPVAEEIERLERAYIALELVIQDNPTPPKPERTTHVHEYSPETHRCVHCGRRKPGRRPQPTDHPRGGRRRAEEVRINVLSSTKPTQQELEDRNVAHTTEEPA